MSKADAPSQPPAREGGASSWLIRHFGRITSGGEFIAEIDGLRFVAIVAVVLFHLQTYVLGKGHASYAAQAHTPLDTLISNGGFGVSLFFTISGIVLSIPFIRAAQRSRPVAVGKYFARRLTRLEPPYVLNLVLLYALLVTVKKQSGAELLPHLLASMVYQHNVIFGEGSAINHVAWSLEVEFQFYALMPLLAPVFGWPAWRRRGLFCALALLGIAIRAVWWDERRILLSLPGHLTTFALGILLADYHFRAPATVRREREWDVLGVAGWLGVIAVMLTPDRQWWTDAANALAVGAAYLGVLRGRRLRAVFGRPLVVVIGGMCYSIYLYHYHVISLLGRLLQPSIFGPSYHVTFALCVALVVLPMLAICAVLFRASERPFMRPRSTKPLAMAIPGETETP